MGLENTLEKIKSFINKDKDYNPDKQTGTAGHAIQGISSITIQIGNALKTMNGSNDSAIAEKNLEILVEGLLELTQKIQPIAEKNPNAKLEDILSAEEYKRYQEITSGISHCEVDNKSIPLCREWLMNRGIPFTEMAHTYDTKSIVVVPQEYARQLREMMRILGINQKSGLTTLAEFDKQNDGSVKMQLTNIEGWEAELIDKLMKEERIPGGQATVSTNINDLKYNIYYRPEDNLTMQKILLKKEMMTHALIDSKSDLILINRLKGRAKDTFLLAHALEVSQLSEFYLCSESIDKFIKLDKDGYTIYSDGKAQSQVKRTDMTEEEFSERFNKDSYHVRNNNMVVIREQDFKAHKMQPLELADASARKNFIAKFHSNNIDVATYDPQIMSELKRLELMPTSDLLKEAQKRITNKENVPSTATIVILKAIEQHIDDIHSNGSDTPFKVPDFLFSQNGEPCISTLSECYSDLAKKMLLHAQSKKEGIALSAEEIDRIENDVIEAQRDLKRETENLKNTYNLSDETMSIITQGLAANCYATFDPNTGRINFSEDEQQVQRAVKQLEVVQQQIMSISETIQDPQLHVGTTLEAEINRDDINTRAMIQRENGMEK